MFRTVPLYITRSFSLYTQQWCMSYKFDDSLRAGSGRSSVRKPVWPIQLLCVQWKTPDDGQRNCPKHVELYSKNKFEKSVHLVGFIIRLSVNTWTPGIYIFFILMYVPCILNSLLSRSTKAQHIYINNILYTVSTPTYVKAFESSSGSLSLVLCWSHKIIKIKTQ